MGRGGTLVALTAHLLNVSISHSSVSGHSAVGGSLFVNGMANLTLVTISNTFTEAIPAQCPDADRDFPAHDSTLPAALGGALALNEAPLFFSELRIENAGANFGGAIALATVSGLVGTGMLISNSHAAVAGGSIYISEFTRDADNFPNVLCNSSASPISFRNSSAGVFGDLCASGPWRLGFAEAGFPSYVAPQEPIEASLFFFDAFGFLLTGVKSRISISLFNASSSSLSLATGEPQDQVSLDDHGEYRFRSIVLSGNETGSTGILRFTPPIQLSAGLDNFFDSPFTLLSCLPSRIPLPLAARTVLQCLECAPGAYYLPQSSRSVRDSASCLPCKETAPGQGTSCLRQLAPNKTQSVPMWAIAQGFYPSPSFDAPEEILPCPTEACLETHCRVRKVTIIHPPALSFV